MIFVNPATYKSVGYDEEMGCAIVHDHSFQGSTPSSSIQDCKKKWYCKLSHLVESSWENMIVGGPLAINYFTSKLKFTTRS